MKNYLILLIVLVNLNLNAQADFCYDFNDESPASFPTNSLDNWIGINGGMYYSSGDGPEGPEDVYLRADDWSGSSWTYNKLDFEGNWYGGSSNECFCFDFKIFENGTPTPNTPNTLFIYHGNSPADYTFRAVFSLSENVSEDDPWKTFCPPIGLSDSSGNLPGNGDGQWIMLDGGTSEDWDFLIQNVSGVAFRLDLPKGGPTEVFGYDDICLEHCPVDTPIYDFDPCCPPMNPTLLADLLHFVPTGPLSSPYKVEMIPNEAFTTQMQAYTDYLATLNPNVEELVFGWNLVDAGDGDEPLTNWLGLGELEHHFRHFYPGGNGMSWTGFYNTELEPNHWYKIGVGIWLDGVEIFDLSCSDDDIVYFNFQIFGGNLTGNVTDGNKHIVRQPTLMMQGEFDWDELFLEADHIEEMSGAPSAQVSPNPFSSEVSVQFDSPLVNVTTMNVIDANGRQLLSEIIEVGITSYHVHLEGLPSGMYTLQFSDDAGNRFFHRIVKPE